jgi:indolepyruvate ferredoxin oxidoreductase beta subunit
MIQRGLITPDRTLLIASTHRALTISEKSHPGDGRANNIKILESAREHARQILAFDMAAVATAHEAVISAVMLGSLAGSGGLPFSQESFRQVIEAGGIATARNLAAFTAGAGAARTALHQPIVAMQTRTAAEPVPALPSELATRISTELPSPARAMASHGVARLLDYQDLELAREYLDKLRPFAALDSEFGHGNALLTTAVARGLALWLSVEDTIRVADLKTRAARQQHLQSESRAKDGQIVASVEFLRPRAEEICGMLPVALGRRLRRSKGFERLVNRFSDGWQIRTSTITGFISLRILAGLRRFRRGTLRFCEEQGRIRSWLTQLQDLAPKNYSLALELAESQSLVRGYGDTYERGWQRFQELSAMAHSAAPDPHAAQRLRELREAQS